MVSELPFKTNRKIYLLILKKCQKNIHLGTGDQEQNQQKSAHFHKSTAIRFLYSTILLGWTKQEQLFSELQKKNVSCKQLFYSFIVIHIHQISLFSQNKTEKNNAIVETNK